MTIKFIFGKCTEPTVPTTFWKIVVKEFPCFLQLTSRIVYMSFHLIAQSQRDLSELQNSKWELPKQNGCWVIDDLLLECVEECLVFSSKVLCQRRCTSLSIFLRGDVKECESGFRLSHVLLNVFYLSLFFLS